MGKLINNGVGLWHGNLWMDKVARVCNMSINDKEWVRGRGRRSTETHAH